MVGRPVIMMEHGSQEHSSPPRSVQDSIGDFIAIFADTILKVRRFLSRCILSELTQWFKSQLYHLIALWS